MPNIPEDVGSEDTDRDNQDRRDDHVSPVEDLDPLLDGPRPDAIGCSPDPATEERAGDTDGNCREGLPPLVDAVGERVDQATNHPGADPTANGVERAKHGGNDEPALRRGQLYFLPVIPNFANLEGYTDADVAAFFDALPPDDPLRYILGSSEGTLIGRMLAVTEGSPE